MKSNIITIDNDEIVVRLSEEHEFLLDSKEVARGYGVSPEVIRTHKRSHADELLEGEHWISVGNPNANPRKGVAHINTLWTKTGVATLGFFIKSERAKKFRRAAAALVVREANRPINEMAILTAMQAMTVTQEKLIGVVETLSKAQAVAEEYSRRLTLGQHNLQCRVEALEA